MSDADREQVEQVKREITAIAAQMACLRDLIDQMRAEGKSTAATYLALEALSELYRQRLQVRQGFEASAEVPDSSGGELLLDWPNGRRSS